MMRSHAKQAVSDVARERTHDRRIGVWFQRAAMTERNGVDRDARTIPAVIATQTPVPIYDRASGRLMQEVLLASGAQLPKWVPMLRQHQRWDLEYVLGSVLDATRSGEQIRAVLQFAAEPDVDPIWGRVRDGHLRGVSCGGRRLTWTDIEPGQSASVGGRRWTAGRMPLRVTSRWLLMEASVVIFGADETSGMGA